ncbi:MAG: protein-disulfide reductase DsbD domain-containing protein [Phycisphaerales bacterium]
MQRRRRLARGLGSSAAVLLASAVQAQLEPSLFGAPAESRVSVQLLTDADPIGPDQTFHIAVRFEIARHWHMYWKNPGAGAIPPSIKVTTPRGYVTSEVLWPRPVAVTTSLGQEYSYFDEVVLFVPITTPATLGDATVTFRVDMQWSVCRRLCLLGSATREITIATSSRPGATGIAHGGTNGRLAAFKKRLPKPLATLAGSQIQFDRSILTLTGPAGDATRAAFFGIDRPGVEFGAAEVTVGDGRFRVVVPVTLAPQNTGGRPMAVGGLVTLGKEADDPSYDFVIETNTLPGLSKP